VLTLAYRLDIGSRTAGEAAVYTPDGQFLLVSGSDRVIRVFNAADGRLVRRLEGHNGNVRTMALVPGTAPRILTGCTDKTIKLWDYTQSGPAIRTFEEQNAYVCEIAPLPDGKRFLAAADNGTIWMWDIESGQVLKRYKQEDLPVYALAVTKDGKRAVAGTWDGKRNAAKPGDDLDKYAPVHVWWFDVESGKEGRRVKVAASVAHVNLSPDDKLAAFGTANGVTTWDLDTNRLRAFEGATNRVTCAIFSKDGRHVLSTGHDRTLHIWEVRTGKPVTFEPGMPAQGYNIGLAPDGKRAAVVGAGGGAIVWNLPAAVVGK
jgi:WD40 repeat protein